MKKNALIFINHILDNIKNIELFMMNVSKEKFFENREKQSAVIREIEIIGEAVLLTKEGRTKIIEEVQKSLAHKTKFKGKKISYSNLILEQGREIVRFLLNQSDKYKPYIFI